jgi:ribonuclease P protein component
MTIKTGKYTFSKDERICKRNDFDRLLQQGQAFNRYPFRVIWLSHPQAEGAPLRLAISVPKRKFRSAVQRNRIKRLIRECFRLNKQVLTHWLKSQQASIDILLIYQGNLNGSFTEMQSKIILILQRLKQLNDQTGKPHPDSLG